MSYTILTISPFDKQLKRLVKKYPSLKNEFAELLGSLEKEPEKGANLGNNCYKIRVAITSKGKGKSGWGKCDYPLCDCRKNGFSYLHL